MRAKRVKWWPGQPGLASDRCSRSKRLKTAWVAPAHTVTRIGAVSVSPRARVPAKRARRALKRPRGRERLDSESGFAWRALRFSAKTSHPRASGRGDVPLGVEIGRPPLPSSPVRCSRGIVSLDSSAGKLLRADADEAELAVPGILAVIEERQE